MILILVICRESRSCWLARSRRKRLQNIPTRDPDSVLKLNDGNTDDLSGTKDSFSASDKWCKSSDMRDDKSGFKKDWLSSGEQLAPLSLLLPSYSCRLLPNSFAGRIHLLLLRLQIQIHKYTNPPSLSSCKYKYTNTQIHLLSPAAPRLLMSVVASLHPSLLLPFWNLWTIIQYILPSNKPLHLWIQGRFIGKLSSLWKQHGPVPGLCVKGWNHFGRALNTACKRIEAGTLYTGFTPSDESVHMVWARPIRQIMERGSLLPT